jgi:hypothetical protein
MNSPNDEPSPNEKRLRLFSFAIHVTRGLVRDQHTRRMTMFVVVLVALLMLFCGSTFLSSVLDARVRPAWFIFYWAICGWVTMTAVLLALLELLMVRAQARVARRALAEKLAREAEREE